MASIQIFKSLITGYRYEKSPEKSITPLSSEWSGTGKQKLCSTIKINEKKGQSLLNGIIFLGMQLKKLHLKVTKLCISMISLLN